MNLLHSLHWYPLASHDHGGAQSISTQSSSIHANQGAQGNVQLSSKHNNIKTQDLIQPLSPPNPNGDRSHESFSNGIWWDNVNANSSIPDRNIHDKDLKFDSDPKEIPKRIEQPKIS